MLQVPLDEQHVRPVLAHRLERLLAINGRRHDLHVALAFQQRLEADQDHAVRIGEHHADGRHALIPVGMSIWTLA